MSCYDTTYKINDHVHLSGFASVDFSVNCTILGICGWDLASTVYNDLLLLFFNNDPNSDYYLQIQDSSSTNYAEYFYIAKIDDGETSAYANDDGLLIIADVFLIKDYCYKLEDELNINIAITYSTYLSGYTSKEALLEDINTFLSEKNLDYTITESYSDEELADRNLQDAMTIVNKLSEIEECTDIIDQLKTVNADEITTTYTNMISLLQNQIDVLLQKIESLS